MRPWFNRCALALGGALALFTVAGSLPVQAAGPPEPVGIRSQDVAGPTGSLPGSSAEGRGAALPATPERVRLVTDYLQKHPIHGSVVVLPKTGAAVALPVAGASGAAAAWTNWWGIRVYLTSSDLRNLFFALTVYGFSAVADAICAPGAFMALACGAAGIVVGYIVAQAVWNTWGYRGGCGLYIDIQWTLYWRTWGC